MSGRTSLYFDLLDARARAGCPICPSAERARLRAARGFCNRHAPRS